jgi:glycosyltransferase involved in cell wall biosynthesis
MKVLLVTLYFPPSGGGGVQRPLKFATPLPGFGIETHVLAPDRPAYPHADGDLVVPTQAWVHRARFVGPEARRPDGAAEDVSTLDRISTQMRLFGRRLLVPDENVSWNLTAIPAAARIVRREGIDVVITTSPPPSLHLLGAAVRRMTGVRWIADLRDSITANPHRRSDSAAVRAKARTLAGVARVVARSADAVVCAAEAIADEVRSLDPHGPVQTIANGCDFDDFAGLEYRRGDRFRITHAGSFFGRRSPRPFLSALASSDLDVVARFVGDFRPADREWAESLGLGDRLDLIPYASHRRSLELQRDSDALLLLIPEADGRGRGVLSGKVFEYLAAERPILAAVPPDGVAAALIDETGTGVVCAPDDADAIRAGLTSLVERWRGGSLNGMPLDAEHRERLDRRARVRELADLVLNLP